MPTIRNPTREVDIRAEDTHVIRDDSSFLDGRGQAPNGVRVREGAHRTTVENVDARRCGTGILATGADDCKILRCRVQKCGAEGVQSGSTRRLLVEDCESWGHSENDWRGPALGTDPDRSHGFYLECPGTGWGDEQFGLRMRRCIGRDCDGMGFHGRGAYLLISDSDFTNNHPGAPGGAGDMQLSGARHVILRRVLLEGGDSGLTLIERCQDVVAEDCAIINPAGSFAVSAWDRAVLVVRGGLVIGRLDRQGPGGAVIELQGTAKHYPTATPEAMAHLAAWRAAHRSALTPAPPAPAPTDDTARLRAERDEAIQALGRERMLRGEVERLLEKALEVARR